jgi:hypothetical protein
MGTRHRPMVGRSPPNTADYSGPLPMTLYQPALGPTGISWSRKRSAPGCSPRASFQGGFTSRRRRGQRPLSSDWRWNSGGSAAVTGERCLVPHLRREPLSRTGSRHASFACLSIDKCEIGMAKVRMRRFRLAGTTGPGAPVPHHHPRRFRHHPRTPARGPWAIACGLGIGRWADDPGIG